MKNIFKSKQNGFAIIEALIAFLLLGIGVAALVYLQGNLMSGSATSKSRAEAMELAKGRTEVLRHYIDRDLYLSALGNLSDESETGVNATYTVSYTLLQDNAEIEATNPLTTDKTQKLTVKVSWTGSEVNPDSTPKVEEVSLETMLYYMSPVIVSATGPGGGGEGVGFSPLLSPFISGVEKADDSTELPNLASTVEDDHRVMVVGDAGDISYEDVNIDIKTYFNTGTGRSNVEVVRIEEDGTETVILTSFGGIVHKIEGDIIVDENANSTLSDLTKKGNTLLGLFASPPSYCLFSICDSADLEDTSACVKSNGWEFASYVCYVPGDCTYGSVDEDGDIDSRCPNPFSTNPFAPPPGMDDLNGGWYGRVGNFHVELPQDKVCTANTDIDDKKTPSRVYVTYRHGDSSDLTKITANEGINTPYSAQNFLIVAKNPVNNPLTDCLTRMALIPENNLVNDHIARQLYGVRRPKTSPLVLSQDNVVFPLNECVGGLDCPPPAALLP